MYVLTQCGWLYLPRGDGQGLRERLPSRSLWPGPRCPGTIALKVGCGLWSQRASCGSQTQRAVGSYPKSKRELTSGLRRDRISSSMVPLVRVRHFPDRLPCTLPLCSGRLPLPCRHTHARGSPCSRDGGWAPTFTLSPPLTPQPHPITTSCNGKDPHHPRHGHPDKFSKASRLWCTFCP